MAEPLDEFYEFEAKQREQREVDAAIAAAAASAARAAAIARKADATLAYADHAFLRGVTGILPQHPDLVKAADHLIKLPTEAKIRVARRRALTHGRGFISNLYAAVNNVNLLGIHWTTDRSFLTGRKSELRKLFKAGYFGTLKRHNFKRKLEHFGFVKLSKREYRHDRFQRGRTDLLETIVRERNQEPEIKSLQEKVGVIEKKINQIDGKMDDFSDKLEGVIRSFEGENNDKWYYIVH